jgi:S1-C subfamily serine protease
VTRLDKLLVGLMMALLLFYVANGRSPFEGDPMSGRRPAPPVAEAPAARNPTPERVRRPPLAPPSAFDPASVVRGDKPTQNTIGTAFPIDDGTWMTARHVILDCARTSLLRYGDPTAVARVTYTHPQADLAIIASDRGGRPIQFAARPLSLGDDGFAVGFPGGGPGAASFQLMGRGRMQSNGWMAGSSPTLTWAVVRRFPERLESFGGLSGGPMVDEEGGVVGVVVAESARRGRVESIAPELLSDVRKSRLPNTDARAAPLAEVRQGSDRLRQIAETVVRERRVGLVYCGR